MLNLKSILIGFCLVSLISCMKLPIYHAQHNSELLTVRNGMQGYDRDSKISWSLQQDETYFELHFQTADKTSILKLLNSGTNIFFDPSGKKKRNISFQYPLKSDGNKEAQSMHTNITGPNRLNSRKYKNNGLQKLLRNLDQRILFQNQGSQEVSDYKNQGDGIYVKLFFEDSETLNYTLRIPKDKIFSGEFSESESFSLGIIADGLTAGDGPKSVRVPMGNRTNNTISRNNRASRNSTGMRPPMSGNRPDISTMSNPINIWFKVDLSQK